MGRRGPAPGQGGRPPKPLAEKMLDGNPGKRKLTVVEFPGASEFHGVNMPPPQTRDTCIRVQRSTRRAPCAAAVHSTAPSAAAAAEAAGKRLIVDSGACAPAEASARALPRAQRACSISSWHVVSPRFIIDICQI